ncbi:metallophosphoesterase [Bradyrhizobium sp. 83012]|uniref:Metallophosphoesterase n=1 Tax=Bradyrhizobium aeschynomenes TaxID=2734909 RepID=A0ABX2C8F5_9BRAD|nr:metallophosphoesterase [Bradyrhizobium aeschynomenes]NPU64544.1 metallophosphoesterase [Bradyrhizobium aeschynomenes]NPV22439.1 metallophosphoesterase [Bradyrhizobium aeschynomenes]
MATTRIAVIGDIHHGQDTPTKRGSMALPLLEQFVAEVNNGRFDAVIDLGDRISDEDPERDRLLQSDVAMCFAKLVPVHHHVSGNHDVGLLSLADNEAILDRPSGSRALTIGDIRCVFWQPDVGLTRERGFRLSAGDLEELVRLLWQDDRPTLLISHVPLSGHAQTGNYYFEANPGHAAYAETDGIRAAIAEAPCPIVALAGHVHWNTLTTVDGTSHLTLQSLTETFISGAPAEAAGILDIEEERLRWTVTGREPLSVTLPWPKTRTRWRAPLARFAKAAVG